MERERDLFRRPQERVLRPQRVRGGVRLSQHVSVPDLWGYMMNVCIHIYIYIYIHTYIHTYTYTYTYIIITTIIIPMIIITVIIHI